MSGAALPAIDVPVLVIQRLDDRITPPCHGRYLAAHLTAARYFEQPGSHLLSAGDTDSLFAQIAELLAGTGQPPRSDRVLCTLLAADAAPRGGAEPDSHTAAIGDIIGAHGGRLLSPRDTAVLVAFNGPARAIRCAGTLHDRVTGRGIRLQLGIHCGEADLLDDGVSGMAVDIAIQLAALAPPVTCSSPGP
jgi:hypothetical protein